jgi:Fur family transcriptional regulator, ferric uptake regulator
MPSNSELSDLLERLREAGKRVTAPKRAVLHVLQLSHEHLTAEDITTAVQASAPDVATSTVYRILDEFEELGIVVHSHVGQHAAVYHLAGQHHVHLLCEDCDNIWQIDAEVFDTLAEALRINADFVLDRHHVALSGRCGPCESAKNKGLAN